MSSSTSGAVPWHATQHGRARLVTDEGEGPLRAGAQGDVLVRLLAVPERSALLQSFLCACGRISAAFSTVATGRTGQKGSSMSSRCLRSLSEDTHLLVNTPFKLAVRRLTWQVLLGEEAESADTRDAVVQWCARRSRRALCVGLGSSLEDESQKSASLCRRSFRPSAEFTALSTSLQIRV